MFPSTEMEISEKWDRSSANYISENWKRNNEHLTMLSKTAKLGYLCWNRIKWCRFWDTDITVGIDVHKKEKFIQFLSSKRQKRGFSVDINVQLNSRCKFWNNFFFRVSSFCTKIETKGNHFCRKIQLPIKTLYQKNLRKMLLKPYLWWSKLLNQIIWKGILWKYSIQSLKIADSVWLSLFMRDNGRCDIPHAA